MNLYAYCLNNPVNWIDPLGQGVYKWLYTGNRNASEEAYDAAVDKAAAVIIQWGVAHYRAHKKAGVWIANASSAVAANAVVFAPIKKTAAELAKGAKNSSSNTTTLSRAALKMRGTRAHKSLRGLARQAKMKPAMTAAKVTGAAVLATEAAIGVNSGIQAYDSDGIHTYEDGSTYDPLGEDNGSAKSGCGGGSK